jgi:hypothetical protein
VRDTSTLTAFSAKARTSFELPLLDCQSGVAKPELQFLGCNSGQQNEGAAAPACTCFDNKPWAGLPGQHDSAAQIMAFAGAPSPR